MGRLKRTVLTAILLSVLGAAEAQQRGTVRGGVQRTFSVADLTDDRLGRIVASSNFQVSLVLPAEVQNVGINASKQAALVPTVDKSDGRVIYLDVLRPGGYATLNIRLVSEGEPLILKLTVELSEATSGVLTYAITTAPRQATQSPLPRAVAAPAPAPRVTPPAARPPAPVARTAPTPPPVARTVPAPTPAARTVPAAASSARPTPAVQAASGVPRSAQAEAPAARQQGGLNVEVSIAPGQSGSARTVTYRIRDVLSTDNITYILAPKVTVRGSGQGQRQTATTTPGVPQRVTESGIWGTFTVQASALWAASSPVALFELRPVDTRLQKPLPARYVGVVVRP